MSVHRQGRFVALKFVLRLRRRTVRKGSAFPEGKE